MKKVCFIIMSLMLVVLLLSACAQVKKTKESMIKYQSKLSQYTQQTGVVSSKKGNVIDLSDGTRFRYDMRFSPKDPTFDVQLKDPYSY